MIEPIQDALIAKRVGTVAIGLLAYRGYLAWKGIPEDSDGLHGHNLIGFDLETSITRNVTKSHSWDASHCFQFAS
jgi:hypothetical protein